MEYPIISNFVGSIYQFYSFLSISLFQLSTTQSCQKERPGFHGERMSHVTKRQGLSLNAKVASSVGRVVPCLCPKRTDRRNFFPRDFNHYQREVGVTEVEWISHIQRKKKEWMR